MSVLAYVYYNNPWRMKSGDDVRIHMILTELAKSHKVMAINLSTFTSSYHVHRQDGVVYVTVPRRFYKFISSLIGWSKHFDLNPLMKLTHYMDEFVTALKFINWFRNAKAIIVFGSMSLFSFMLRILGAKNVTIIYDTLANYAQTLYLRSRKSFVELLRYGLYLALHKLQLKSSNIVVYPSHIDLENAKRMFRVAKAVVIPNLTPICYNSVEEYLELREKRKDFDKPYFILLAGGRGKGNEEAVRITIEVFNELPAEKFKLLITGPWQDMGKHVKNPSIELLGVVPREKLKELLAISDYGLAPVFSHSSGTFLKVLAYISAGLDVIGSPYSITGITIPKGVNIYLAKSKQEYASVVKKIVNNNIVSKNVNKERPINLCRELLIGLESMLK
jgi:glycosyltransferase involved in cell wall biosynthesis